MCCNTGFQERMVHVYLFFSNLQVPGSLEEALDSFYSKFDSIAKLKENYPIFRYNVSNPVHCTNRLEMLETSFYKSLALRKAASKH